MKKHMEDAIILENVRLNPTTCRMILQAPAVAREARPGQFVMVRVDSSFDPFLRRPFSFFRIDRNEGIIELVYRIVGKGTKIMSTKQKGETVNIVGPMGNGFRPPPEDAASVWFVAGGIGMAALVACMEDIRLRRPRSRRVLFYGAKTHSEFIPKIYFSSLCHEVHYSTDDGSAGFCGTVLDCMKSVTGANSLPSYLYACGPPSMLKHTANWVIENKIPAQFCLESVMGCGMGACLGCALPGQVDYGHGKTRFVHVCFEGPVFYPEQIRWEEL
ncbi:dihydroorotate dehydrogenase electron transfer subunit [Thermodesulforhabdus norvegica]|uniref:Dihydroorotate oxidase B, electron transfer subunit n=1 Tax=Thermodesulforhabdus norvegica TaxID=39841 RepID=A0A1I4QR22_9BACT|nr:dihydroorotate dehydrogenase electron transfer subunit [Thermodesulforhabdus norvegica]SFM42524.1 dihydroorotate oxidase B, electron transfer subunit [Thermodesulforhabdus norvegica]